MAEAEPEPEPEPAIPQPKAVRLVDAHVTITTDGQAMADVWLDVLGRPLHGHGMGATTLGGRHLAVARAAVDALRPVLGSDVTLESMTLSASRADEEEVHVVVTLTAPNSRWAGTATSPPAGEESGAALAVLDAIGAPGGPGCTDQGYGVTVIDSPVRTERRKGQGVSKYEVTLQELGQRAELEVIEATRFVTTQDGSWTDFYRPTDDGGSFVAVRLRSDRIVRIDLVIE